MFANRVVARLMIVVVLSALAGCTKLGAHSKLEGKWQGVQEVPHDTTKPLPLFDPALTFDMEFKSDHSLRARLPEVNVVYGTWKVDRERRNSLDLTLSYSNDGKSKYVQTMSVQFVSDSQFTAQPPGAPGLVRFSRVK